MPKADNTLKTIVLFEGLVEANIKMKIKVIVKIPNVQKKLVLKNFLEVFKLNIRAKNIQKAKLKYVIINENIKDISQFFCKDCNSNPKLDPLVSSIILGKCSIVVKITEGIQIENASRNIILAIFNTKSPKLSILK